MLFSSCSGRTKTWCLFSLGVNLYSVGIHFSNELRFFLNFLVLILLLLVLPLLLLIQGQHCWRSRNPSATAGMRCTIGPATAHRGATARGAACYATTSPSLSPRCKEFPVAKLLASHSTASADVRLLTPFLYAMQQPLWAQPRGWNLTGHRESATCCLNVVMLHCFLIWTSDAELCLTFFFTVCWVVSRDLKSNGLLGQIPDEIGDCLLLETL